MRRARSLPYRLLLWEALRRRARWMPLGLVAALACDAQTTEAPPGPLFGDPRPGDGVLQGALTDPSACGGSFGWSELIATAAEVTPSPSLFGALDTRAGSLEVNTTGGFGFDGVSNDPPFGAAIVTLRSGTGDIVEQAQVGRRWTPGGLDAEGCREYLGHPQCWLTAPADLIGGFLTALLPDRSGGSNDGFDPGGDRVAIAGGIRIDHQDGAPTSATDAAWRVRWTAPKGLDTARALLRVHFDADLDGDLNDNPLITLFRLRWDGDGPDLLAPGLVIASKSDTAIEITGDMAAALALACSNPFDGVCDVRGGGVEVDANRVYWTLTNGGAEPTTLTSLFVAWPSAAGKLKNVRLDGTTVMDTAIVGPSVFLDTEWKGDPALRVLAPGQTRVLRLEFEKSSSTSVGDFTALAAFHDGCLLEMRPPTAPECTRQSPDVCFDGVKPTALTLTYTGESCAASSNTQDPAKAICSGDPASAGPVFVRATDKSSPTDTSGKKFFEGSVALGGSFTLSAANAGGTTLPSGTWVHLFGTGGALLQTVGIHTSCSQPLFVGDRYGSLALDSYTPSVPVEPWCPELDGTDLCVHGKPTTLALEYTGAGCGATSHAQDPSKVACSGDPAGASPVRIRVNDRSNPTDLGGKVWFDGVVEAGDIVQMAAANAGATSFAADTYVYVHDAVTGALLQSIKFHTSCSQPLRTGDEFGGVRIDGIDGGLPTGTGTGGDTGGGGEVCAEQSPDVCFDGIKPTALTLTYTGEGCGASSNTQDPGKAPCSGDPAAAPAVFVRATDKSSPSDLSGKKLFEGTVALGAAFTLSAANAGGTTLPSGTWIHLFDGGGALLQTVGVHTSCSQPLFVGDQFGSLLLDSYTPSVPVEPWCPDLAGTDLCAHGKPATLALQYTGQGCAATSHAQDPSKVACSGDPAGASPVRVRVNDRSNPADLGGKVWFDGVVDAGGALLMDAAAAGSTSFASDTYVYVHDAQTGALLQSIKFHTSCSQPLRTGDQFGSMQVIGVATP